MTLTLSLTSTPNNFERIDMMFTHRLEFILRSITVTVGKL